MLADSWRTEARGYGCDVHQDLLPAASRLNEAIPAIGVPRFELAVESHWRKRI
jgi:hypothetical protein